MKPFIKVSLILSALLFFPFSASFAKAGCCSHHGGIVGCDAATGHLKCQDGSDSPSCPCKGTTLTQPNKSKSTPMTPANPARAKPQPQPQAQIPIMAPRGCCSRHGGAVSCKNGYFVCKDGTRSATCKCR